MSSTLLFLLLLRPDAAPVPDEHAVPGDAEITRAVERELLLDPVVPSHAIDVATQDGVVALSGAVSDLLARERATRIAETVRGVRSAVNTMIITGALRPDDEIARDVQDALLDDPATDAYEVTVDVADAHVTLGGRVDSWAERQLAETVAKSVRGVVWVDNGISVSFDESRPDSEIESDVEQRLHWSVLIDDALVDVVVADGIVTLSGTVASAAQKRLAQLEARVSGVRGVDASELRVEPCTRDDAPRDGAPAMPGDDELRLRIERTLTADPRVSAFEVQTSVRDGRVVLAGVVDNLEARRVAERRTRRLLGVASVTNLLKVRPALVRTDDDVERAAREAIARSPQLDAEDITVRVRRGVASLRGMVDSYLVKGLAEDVVARVPGVVDLRNGLVVPQGVYAYDPFVDAWDLRDHGWIPWTMTSTSKTDVQIAADIREQLLWSPFIDAGDVEVRVEDGVATITGRVDTWLEWNAARENAYEGGATSVRNLAVLD